MVFLHFLVVIRIINALQCLRKELSRGEREPALGDVHRTNLPGEVIQSAKQICMNLLKSFRCSDLNAFEQGTLEQRVCLRFALPVDGVLTISEPLYETRSLVVGHILGQFNNTLGIEYVGII